MKKEEVKQWKVLVNDIRKNKALENRLKALAQKYGEGDYRFTLRMFGFPIVRVQNKEELKGRMKELADILRCDWVELEDDKGIKTKIELR